MIAIVGNALLDRDPLVARVLLEYAAAQAPSQVGIWTTLGAAYDRLHCHDRAQMATERALSLKPGHEPAESNMSTLALHRCKPLEAIEWAERILARNPDDSQAHINIGEASLHLRDYARGWQEWAWGMGRCEYRDVLNYGVPEWDGSKGKRLIVYGEQGLGDEIFLSNALKDAIEDSESVVYDTHKKIRGLMDRSFACEVHATRLSPETPWIEGREFDAAISLSQLQQFYRNSPESWDGKPYLTPDPERVVQWKALLDSLGGGLKVGIAWTGGSTRTQRAERSAALESWLPILKTPGVHFVSLEYKPCDWEVNAFCERNGIRIHDWPRANQTTDLDDQAGLVGALDLVIAVPTTVVHLAGAMGVPTWCLIHRHPHCFFGIEGQMPQYGSVTLYRRKSDDWAVARRVAKDLVKRRGS